MNILVAIVSQYNLMYIFLGTLVGSFTGAMPGLDSGTGILIFLPLTVYMGIDKAMAFCLGIYVANMCTGGITSTFLGIPGTPNAAITMLDGHPMALKGQPEKASGIIISSSFFGGIFSLIVLIYGMEILGKLAYKFGPFELFFAALLGIMCAVGVGGRGKYPLKSLVSGFIGILIGTIGYSPIDIYTARATFGFKELLDGVPFVPLLIGMLAMPQVFTLAETEFIVSERVLTKGKVIKKIFSGFFYVLKKPIDVFWAALIGTIVGIIPGQGATTSCFMSYSRAKESSKNKNKFGTGIPEGIIASEGANSASVGGGLLTTLLLGIPGTGTCAILLGVLMLHGIRIGPALAIQFPETVKAIFTSLFIANLFMLLVSIIIVNYFNLVVSMPVKLLLPLIAIGCTLGTYLIRNSIMDVWIMYFSCVLAILMEKYNYPTLPLVIAVIVTPIADAELIRAIIIFRHRFISSIFSSSINCVLIGLNILFLYLLFKPSKSE